MIRRILNLVLIALTLVLSTTDQLLASHAMGSDIEYSCLGTNILGQTQYQVTVSFYRDCDGVPAPTSIDIDYSAPLCGINNNSTVTLNQNLLAPPTVPGGQLGEVTTLCPSQIQCSSCNQNPPIGCPTPLLQGVQEFTYSGVLTLPSNCSQWIISYDQCCRNNLITNLVNPAAQSMYIESTINNAVFDTTTGDSYCNNSPVFTSLPVPYLCVNQSWSYNFGAVDPDGDSLTYSLVTPLDGFNAPITYVFPFSPTYPLNTLSGMVNFDTTSGQMSFTPVGQQVAVFSVLIEEWRDGVLIGTTTRDVQLIVINCMNSTPNNGSINNLIGGNGIDTNAVQVCPGTSISFNILVIDPSGFNLTVTSNLQSLNTPMPGATFTTLGTGDSITVVVTWTPTFADSGNHQFVITALNDACPVSGSASNFYEVFVFNGVSINPDSAVYCGTPVQLQASGGSTFSWFPIAGLSDPTILNPLAFPSVPTNYVFSSNCGADTTFIDVDPPFLIDAGPEDTICANGQAQLQAMTDSIYPPYTFVWYPATDLINPITGLPDNEIGNPIASPQVTTTYWVYATGSNGCERYDSMTVWVQGVAPIVVATVDQDTICQGNPINLDLYSNPAQCGLSFQACGGVDVTGDVGVGTIVSGGSPTQYPSIYGNWSNSARQQIIYRASDLIGAIGSGGKIKEIGFEIGQVFNLAQMQNFSIRMGCTNASSLNNWIGNTEEVFTPKNVTPVAGWNTHVLDFEYDWDGVSNLVVEICFFNPTSGNFNNKNTITTTPYNSVIVIDGSTDQCSLNFLPTTVTNQRPNTRFTFCTTDFSILDIDWSPSAGINMVSDSALKTPTAIPMYTETYQVDVTDSGCTGSNFITVFVDSLAAQANNDTFICATTAQIQLGATITGGGLGQIGYFWTAFPPDPSLTNPTLLNSVVSPTVPTTYVLDVTNGVCSATDTMIVILGGGIPVTLNVSHISCTGVNDGQIIAEPLGGFSPFTYVWNIGGGNIDTQTALGPGQYSVTVTDSAGCAGSDTVLLSYPTPLQTTMSGAHLDCNGDADGTVSVSVSGGTLSYSYSWNIINPSIDTADISGLDGGNYIVLVTDGSGCTTSDTFFVNEPTALTTSMNAVNVSINSLCDGGAAVSPSGGTPSYTYSWSPVASISDSVGALCIGTYVVTVTDSLGCIAVDSIAVTEPAPFIVEYDTSHNPCNGDSLGRIVIDTIYGGTTPYGLTWVYDQTNNTDSLTGLPAGFYDVIVVDSVGDSIVLTIPIFEPTAVVIDLDTVDIDCYAAANGELTANVTGGVQPYSYAWNTPAPMFTPTITGIGPGPYTVAVTDNNGCLHFATGTVVEPPDLVVSAISAVPSVGNGSSNGSVSVTAAGGTPGYTYNWTPGGYNTATVNQLPTGWYTVTITDLNGCSIVDSVFVEFFTVSIQKTDNLCYGVSNGSATVIINGGTPPYTYSWNTNPVTTTSTANNLAAGIYEIGISDSNGYNIDTSVIITQPDSFTIVLNPTDATCNAANDGLITSAVSGATPPYTYFWNPGAMVTANVANLAPNTYTLVVTDFNLCQDSSTAPITEPMPLVATITSTTDVSCYGYNDGIAVVQATGGNGNYNYNWGGSSSGTASANDLLADPAHFVIVTDMNNCTDTATFVIDQPDSISLTLAWTDASCETSNDGTASVVATGGTAGYTYNWNPGGLNTANVTSLDNGTYTVVVTDAHNCPKTESVFIDTQYVLSVTTDSDSTDCFGGAEGSAWVQVNNGNGPYNYAWNSTLPQFNDVATNLTAGNYNVTVTDAVGCLAVGFTTVDQPDDIILSLDYEAPSCAGFNNGKAWVTVDQRTFNYSYNYAWSNGGNADTTYNLTAGNVSVVVTDNKGCFKNGNTLVVDPPTLQLNSVRQENVSCFGELDGLLEVVATGGTSPFSYDWSDGQNGPIANNLSAGPYYIEVFDNNGCTDSINFTVTEPPVLEFVGTFIDSASCYDYNDGLISIAVAGGTPDADGGYLYSSDDISYQVDPIFADLTAGVYTIYAMDENECLIDTILHVGQPAPLFLYVEPQENKANLGLGVQITTDIENYSEEYINSYSWSPSIGLDCSDCPEPFATPYHTTVYTLTVNYLNDCFITDDIEIYINQAPGFFIPNAFTPNNDGENDVFEIYGETVKSMHMQIFNKWGELVFEGFEQHDSWDGTFKGELQNPGVFTVMAEIEHLNGTIIPWRGSVVLIR